MDKANIGETCSTSDSCVADSFCLRTQPDAEEGLCYLIPEKCYSGCTYHRPEGSESPLCESMISCEDSEDLESYLLTCDNDSSPAQLEGFWLDNGRISDGPQCSMRAYVIPEPGDPPEGCPNCDIVFNARLDFYYDSCDFLSSSAMSNGVYFPFGLQSDQFYVYQNGQWINETPPVPERGWRNYYFGYGYWEDIGSVSYFHSINFEISW